MKKLSVAELVLVPVRTFRTEQVNAATVAEYAALMERGVEFPPLTIAEVGKAKQLVMVGGMHRLAAAVKTKLTELPVNLVACAAAIDAEVLAYTDNGSHGLRLTAEENRKALLAILQTPTFAKLSHAAAAKRLGVSDMSVKRYRDAVGEKSPKVAQSGHKAKSAGVKVDKGGKVEAVPVSKPGKASAWHIHEGGSWSGGGVDQIVEAITTRVTEGIGRKSVKSWNERCDYLRSIAAQLTAWADANSAKE